jgi:hypothetical protein
MTQPKALFLADVIDADLRSATHHDEAAAELRRLHEVNYALREALKDALFHVANQGDVGVDQWLACERKARNVIAKVEGR